MNNSLQPKDCTIISSDITTDNTVTINLDELRSELYNYNTMHSYTLQASDTITLSGQPHLTTDQITTLTSASIGVLDTNWIVANQFTPVAFKDNWPEWLKTQRMRKLYPSLDRAFAQLETVYNLVKDDYDNPVPKK
jgi:hypothetical protein